MKGIRSEQRASGTDRARTWRWALIVSVGCIVLADSLAYAYKLYEGSSAFLRWQPQILELLDGSNIFRSYAYPNPPIMPLALAPLAALPPKLGAMLFYFIKVALAGVTSLWALRLARGRSQPIPDWAIGLTLLVALRPLLEDLQHGNVNIVVGFTVMAALNAFSRGRDASAGLLLALATSCKVTPGLFLAYFLYKRQWRLLLFAALGLGLFLFAIPSLALGWAFNVECLKAYYEMMIRPYAIEGVISATTQNNQSIPGITHRLLTAVYGLQIRDEYLYVNVASLDPAVARGIVRALSLAVLGLLGWICRVSTSDRLNWRLAGEYSLVFIAMLLLSERSWKAHYVVMLLPYAWLVTRLVSADTASVLRQHLMRVLAAAFMLMLFTSGELAGWLYWHDGHPAGHHFAEAYGAFALSAVIAFAAICVLLVRETARERRPRL